MIRADIHMHSDFSHDSAAAPEQMADGALEKGLDIICFTDHYDKDNMEWGPEDIFVPEDYWEKMEEMREAYHGRLDIRIGVELGLLPDLGDYYREFVRRYPYDFVIGSVHSIRHSDIAKKNIFRGRTDAEVYRMTFEETLEDIRAFDDFDALGHLDYVVRYGREDAYTYRRFSDEIDAVLRALIEKGKGLELNMAGLKYGLKFAHPHMDVLKRYRELGGEIVTVGADAHRPEHIAYDFGRAQEILAECGFRYYTVFSQRKPEFYGI